MFRQILLVIVAIFAVACIQNRITCPQGDEVCLAGSDDTGAMGVGDGDTGGGDNNPVNRNPFEGPAQEMVNFRLVTSFNEVEEPTSIRIRCGSQEVGSNSDAVFKVRRGSTCTATLGDSAQRTGSSSGNRPLHESGEGLLWTGAIELEFGETEILASRINREDETIDIAESGATTIAFDGDWWFATPRIDCIDTVLSNGTQFHLSAENIIVEENNMWQAGSISSSASWFVNVSNSFDWGAGDLFERGWRVTSVDLGDKTFFANTRSWNGEEGTLDCEWE